MLVLPRIGPLLALQVLLLEVADTVGLLLSSLPVPLLDPQMAELPARLLVLMEFPVRLPDLQMELPALPLVVPSK